MSLRRCRVVGCKHHVREGLLRTVNGADGLADGVRCARCRAPERREYVAAQNAKQRNSNTGTKTAAVQDADRFYALDGNWHPSVASKLSNLHRESWPRSGRAMCSVDKILYLDDGGYTRVFAEADRRTLCKMCERIWTGKQRGIAAAEAAAKERP